MNALEKLLAEAREAPPPVDNERLVRQRSRLVEASARGSRRSVRHRASWLWGVVGATAAALSGLVWFTHINGTDRQANQDLTASAAAQEVWWSAVAVPTQHIVDGRGELSLVSGASAHLSQQGARVNVSLERGEVSSRVVPHRGTAWAVQAGAYSVQAVGTEFRVRHEPTRDRLDVTVEEGTVRVAGGALGSSDVLLHAGQALHVEGSRVAIDRRPAAGVVGRVDSTDGEQELGVSAAAEEDHVRGPDGAPGTTTQPNLPQAVASNQSTALSGESTSPTVVTTPSQAIVAPPTDWKTHHSQGDHKAALEAVVKQGFDEALRQASCSDLSKLADTTRLAGDEARSTAALNNSRSRCTGTVDGARSAFLLGRQLDASRPAEAAVWYQAYLNEAPGGAFAEQALGRQMAVQERSGQRAKAQAGARVYLRKYPKGLYAELAQTLLEP